MKQRKYTYLKVLQQNVGYGWDDVDCFDLHASTVQERKQRLKEYRETQPRANYRWVARRELNV